MAAERNSISLLTFVLLHTRKARAESVPYAMPDDEPIDDSRQQRD